jgi:KaiC/GvpD/RAD55 family RecA-like ATPase
MILRSKTEPAIPYLWSGIKVGSFGFIFGPSKSGKTTFCENLALSIATNQETFFNKPILEGLRKVLFISMEEFWQPRTERNEKQLQELGVGIGDNFLTVNENFPRILNSKEDWELLKNHIIETDSEVVFIDSLSRLYSGSIEDSQLAKELLYKLRELTNELKITLIVIHHTPKQIGRPLTIDSLAGSRMLAQEADFMIGISKSLDGIRYMKEVAFRYAPENDETVTTFQINANAWLCPSYEVPEHSLLKNSDGRKDDSNKEIMLDYIEENYDVNKEFFTRTLIEQLVNTKIMAKPTMYSCLEKLTRDKKIKKVSKGKYMLCPEQA